MAGAFLSTTAQAQEPVLVSAIFCDKPEYIETLVYVHNKAKNELEEALGQTNELAKQQGAAEPVCGQLQAVIVVGETVGKPLHDDQLNLDIEIKEVAILAVQMGPGVLKLPEPVKAYVAAPIEGRGA